MINVYLIARISQDAHAWNKKITNILKRPVKVFLPQEHNPYNIQHTNLSKRVYDIDLAAMKKAHIALALPEFGSDCSYEVGWFSNSSKPVVFFVDTQLQWLRNWMVKGGLDYVITTDPMTYQALIKDPILKFKKVKLIKHLRELNNIIKDIHRNLYVEENSKS
jgi:nucleoside 2-deoxyribosyltransferase